MERTSAACAMEWSIDLEKGLRSKNPGHSLEAILRIGQKLEQWDREPAINKAQYNMFGLIQGEDRLFANTIVLRLTGTFCSGDTQTKLCVVKVFLSLLRNRKKRGGKYCGILRKCSSKNWLELLRRVKNVFDSGDAESRALALILFGCWADVAKDNADIRYHLLSSLVSCDVLQVEASLFAGGCFSELSDDFASIFLEILVNTVASSETSLTVRLAGVRAFAKMACSSSHASKAYKAGLKLMLDSVEEDFVVGMLISLSKLAAKSTCLISGQASLLFSYLTQEKPLRLQATALKCLHYILVKGMCHFPAADSVRTLVSMLDESEFPPALHCGALQILHKILLYNLPTMHYTNMLEFSNIITVLESATKSLIMAKRLLAIRVLSDILGNLTGSNEKALDGADYTALASWVISFVIDLIGLLIKLVLDCQQVDSEMEREGQSLLGILLLLVKKHPDLGGTVMDKVCLLVEYISSNHSQLMGTAEPDVPGHEIIELRGENSKFISTKLFLGMPKAVVAYLENLNEVGAVNTQVLDTTETLVKLLQRCSLFDFFPYTVYTFLLHSHVTYCLMFNEIQKNDDLDRKLFISLEDYLVQRELLSLECAKNILERKEYSSAYKVGKYAACQGAWFTAAFIFKHLITKVQSSSTDKWLKSLSEFAHSERNGHFHNSPNNIENIIEACNNLRLSEETMGAMVTSGNALSFQRWFLSLRAKVLESVADVLKLYHVPFPPDNFDNVRPEERNIVVERRRFLLWITSVACSLTQISTRLDRLAREFDLIATSFCGMDKRSLEVISTHALSCSLLAFSAGFSLFFPNLHVENILGKSEEYLHGMLIQDLGSRLRQIDCEIITKLGFLWQKVHSKPKSLFFQSRSQMFNVSCEARCLLTVCSYAVTRVVGLHNEANKAHDVEILHRVTKDGLQLLLDVITKCMLIPFRMPSYFFRVRPCILSELFVLNSDNRSQDGISILPGFHLSLDLCLQLKNISPDLQVVKLYCILYCRMSFEVPDPERKKGQMQLDYRDWESDDMICLNDKLLRYVTEDTHKASSTQQRRNAGDCGVVDVCICFEPNENGQGFSSCLLDVSTFPLGSYRIKWCSCFVDNKGSYWSLLPLNAGPVFTVQNNVLKD